MTDRSVEELLTEASVNRKIGSVLGLTRTKPILFDSKQKFSENLRSGRKIGSKNRSHRQDRKNISCVLMNYEYY